MQVIEPRSLGPQLGENEDKHSDDPEKPAEEKKAHVGASPARGGRRRAAPVGVTGAPAWMASTEGRV